MIFLFRFQIFGSNASPFEMMGLEKEHETHILIKKSETFKSETAYFRNYICNAIFFVDDHTILSTSL